MDAWQYDEFKHRGIDYSKVEQAEIYDERHQMFRDFRKEFDGMMAFLEIDRPETMTLIDLGCGTGALSVMAAARFRSVCAVDVSEAMLDQARGKAAGKFDNIVFAHGGFLTYRHTCDAADVVVTKMALHHLPDFWKQIALLRINRMLKPGGRFYLYDVVFRFAPAEYAARIGAWIEGLEAVAGERFRCEIEAHIRNEYSTFDWVLKGMLERAGFAVEKDRSSDGFLCEYACRKATDTPLVETA